MNLYCRYADFLVEHFSFKVQKLPVDAGFTCPNRDGTKGKGGCTYCNNRSFHPDYGKALISIKEQLEAGKKFFESQYTSMKYLAYFQSYTNTYAPVEVLKDKYEEAMKVKDVVGLVISTRPDCLKEEVIDLLQMLNQRTFVMVEIGVESIVDRELREVNRCHTFVDSEDAIRRVALRQIPVCAHLIFGLSPTFSAEETARKISSLPVSSVKIHQLQILKGTKMSQTYSDLLLNDDDGSRVQERYPCLKLDNYLDALTTFIAHLRPDISLERMVSQSPASLLVAPKWGLKPDTFEHLLQKRLLEQKVYQGMFY